jgi:hypothetical protein
MNRWCYIGASINPGGLTSKAPTYALYPRPYPSDKLQ